MTTNTDIREIYNKTYAEVKGKPQVDPEWLWNLLCMYADPKADRYGGEITLRELSYIQDEFEKDLRSCNSCNGHYWWWDMWPCDQGPWEEREFVCETCDLELGREAGLTHLN